MKGAENWADKWNTCLLQMQNNFIHSSKMNQTLSLPRVAPSLVREFCKLKYDLLIWGCPYSLVLALLWLGYVNKWNSPFVYLTMKLGSCHSQGLTHKTPIISFNLNNTPSQARRDFYSHFTDEKVESWENEFISEDHTAGKSGTRTDNND